MSHLSTPRRPIKPRRRNPPHDRYVGVIWTWERMFRSETVPFNEVLVGVVKQRNIRNDLNSTHRHFVTKDTDGLQNWKETRRTALDVHRTVTVSTSVVDPMKRFAWTCSLRVKKKNILILLLLLFFLFIYLRIFRIGSILFWYFITTGLFQLRVAVRIFCVFSPVQFKKKFSNNFDYSAFVSVRFCDRFQLNRELRRIIRTTVPAQFRRYTFR